MRMLVQFVHYVVFDMIDGGGCQVKLKFLKSVSPQGGGDFLVPTISNK